MAFLDSHRDQYGVEPICQMLQIAPSWYYEQKARQVDPSPASLFGYAATASFATRSVASGSRTSEPTGLAKSGSSCIASLSRWPAALWNG